MATTNKIIKPSSMGKPGNPGPPEEAVVWGSGGDSWATIQTELMKISKIEANIFLLHTTIIVLIYKKWIKN